MALKACYSCNKKVSTLADRCPHCGADQAVDSVGPMNTPVLPVKSEPEYQSVTLEALRGWLALEGAVDSWAVKDSKGEQYAQLTLSDVGESFGGQEIMLTHQRWAAPRRIRIEGAKTRESAGTPLPPKESVGGATVAAYGKESRQEQPLFSSDVRRSRGKTRPRPAPSLTGWVAAGIGTVVIGILLLTAVGGSDSNPSVVGNSSGHGAGSTGEDRGLAQATGQFRYELADLMVSTLTVDAGGNVEMRIEVGPALAAIAARSGRGGVAAPTVYTGRLPASAFPGPVSLNLVSAQGERLDQTELLFDRGADTWRVWDRAPGESSGPQIHVRVGARSSGVPETSNVGRGPASGGRAPALSVPAGMSRAVTATGTSGGPVAARGRFGSDRTGVPCIGNIPREPQHVIDVQATQSLAIVARVQGQGDLTIVVEGASGVLCNDDFDGLNPGVTGQLAQGRYSIYVGTYAVGSDRYTLTVEPLRGSSTVGSGAQPATGRCGLSEADWRAVDRMRNRLVGSYEGVIVGQNQLYGVGVPIDLDTILMAAMYGDDTDVVMALRGQFFRAGVFNSGELLPIQRSAIQRTLGFSNETIDRILRSGDQSGC